LPRATATAMFGLPSVGAALETIRRALDTEAGQLRAAEALWQSFMRFTAAAHAFSEPGLELDRPIYLLLSLGGAREDTLRAEFERLFEETLQRFPEASGIIAGSRRQEDELWRLREDTDILYRTHPDAPSYDVSVPLSALDAYVAAILSGLSAIEPDLAPYLFGHLADGNLHIVLNRAGPLPDGMAAAIEDVLYRDIRALGGSFSAEHGVGSKRLHSLVATADPVKLKAMQSVRRALDGQSTMNPGKVLPQDGAADPGSRGGRGATPGSARKPE
jgi:FAD/FMN-containing dehydrogenase